MKKLTREEFEVLSTIATSNRKMSLRALADKNCFQEKRVFGIIRCSEHLKTITRLKSANVRKAM